jgi:hypothetical protein
MATAIPPLKRISLRPQEIVFGDVVITLDAPRAVDVDVARKEVGVAGVAGAVELLEQNKRVVWRPSRPLAPGRYRFSVGELAARSGVRFAAPPCIPFAVVRSRARVPDAVAVESIVRLRLGERGTQRLSPYVEHDGDYIELMKGVDRQSEAPVRLAFDSAGNRIEGDDVLARAEVERARHFGRLHEALFHARRAAGRDERLPVAVWFDTDPALLDAERPARPQRARPRALAAQQRTIDGAARAGARVVEEVGGRPVRLSRVAPVVFAELSPAEIDRLADHSAVAGLFLHDPRGTDDLEDSMAIANSDDVHALGIRGAGIRVAVWEDGPDVTTNLTIAGRFTSSPDTSDHSRHVHGIIRNTEPNAPRGHARSCMLFSANDKDLDALEWAVEDEECTVINQSFHRRAEATGGDMSFDDIYKDWVALRWPYPTICQAAGNHFAGDSDGVDPTSDEFVNHKGYNSLAVGNHNDDASAMSTSSVFRNPSSAHGDRELPEITANGTSVTTVGLLKSGTSMASPACAGVAALLQSTNATLEHWPEGCRAILLAGATRNVVDSTWWDDVADGVDASDGSGAVNALRSHRIALQRKTASSAASRRGWDIGRLTSADFDGDGMSTFGYRIAMPSHVLAPRHVKVALAWTSTVSTLSIFGITLPIRSRLTVDLDLKIFDARGNQVGYSGSWDNSYEIAEFTGTPGQTYTIRVRRWAGTDAVWFGIAWTVTGPLLVLEDISDLDLERLRRGTGRAGAPRPSGRSRRKRRARSR